MDLPRVDRTQPVVPQRGFEQRTKASNAVDAGHGDKRHRECRTVHDGDRKRGWGRSRRGGEMLAWRLRVGQEDETVRLPLAPARSLASGAASFVRQGYLMRWIS